MRAANAIASTAVANCVPLIIVLSVATGLSRTTPAWSRTTTPPRVPAVRLGDESRKRRFDSFKGLKFQTA